VTDKVQQQESALKYNT